MKTDLNSLLNFLDRSPTSFHAVEETASLLMAGHFNNISASFHSAEFNEAQRGFFCHKGTVIAYSIPNKITADTSLRMIAAHTDSPGLKLKTGNLNSAEKIAFEVYGSPLLYTWFDRDLGVAGQIHFSDGSFENVFIQQNILHLSSLAIHLNRNVNSDGFKISPQKMLISFPEYAPLVDILKQKIAVASQKEVIETELFAVDLQPASYGGLQNETIHSDRLDNLAMVFSSFSALLDLPQNHGHFCVVGAFDHEEVGSESDSGAASSRAMRNIELLWNSIANQETSFEHILNRPGTMLLSADMAHAWHPAHPDVYDAGHRVFMNHGPVIKYNAKQRYATSSSEAAYIRRMAKQLQIPVQSYYSHNDLPCGSTVGPIMATGWGIPAIDMGNAMLGMHSIRETCGSQDIEMMTRLMGGFLKG